MDKQNYAKIHSIETYGTVDGPGVRFVCFFQGCHLECKYCHNRDTWDINSGKYISADELFNEIMKYKTFITPNGGFTASGGEPLLQPYFLISLFKKLKEANIHTAIDTSGMIKITNTIKELLKYTDLVLLDIKHINPQKCKELVGFSNEKELAFARYLNEHNIPVWIRQVIVPGITDDENDLLKLHELMMKYFDEDNGNYRNHGEGVKRKDEIIYMVPESILVPSLMKSLFEYISSSDLNIIILFKKEVVWDEIKHTQKIENI